NPSPPSTYPAPSSSLFTHLSPKKLPCTSHLPYFTPDHKTGGMRDDPLLSSALFTIPRFVQPTSKARLAPMQAENCASRRTQAEGTRLACMLVTTGEIVGVGVWGKYWGCR
ncbi:hypothetical protein COCVIDRAFT_88803, partial [Bipolaris victoriae FI3]